MLFCSLTKGITPKILRLCVCVTVIFCGVPVWCCFVSAETVWTVGACTLLGYHYVAYLDLGQELSGDN